MLQISNYYGIAGAFRNNEWMELSDKFYGDICTNGMFFPESRTAIAKIEDGTSHTLAVGERKYVYCPWMTGAIWIGSPPTQIENCSCNNVRFPINAEPSEFGYYKF